MTLKTEKINPSIRLKENGELKIKTDLLDDLYTKLDLNDRSSIEKLRKRSKTRIQTANNYFLDIFSVPKTIVVKWIKLLNLVSVPGLHSKRDLESGKYEGGFKVWESTNDLVKFLTQDESIVGVLLNRGVNLKVLELGAGAALPSLALLGRLIEDTNFHSEYRFHLQDYNWQVLASLTLLNFAVNLPADYVKELIECKSLRYFQGDWKNFRNGSKFKYDLIMMSEAIYNSDNYESLHELLDRHLEEDGYVIIATKNTYFGLTGGLYSWIEYVRSRKVLEPYETLQVTTTNIPRSILILRRIRE